MGLIGKFKDFVPRGRNPPVRMNAIAGGRLLALEDCYFDGLKVEYTSGGQSGLTRHKYHSDLFFAGSHWDDLELLQFKNVFLHLRYLEQWIRPSSHKPIGYEDRVEAWPRIAHTFNAFKRLAVVNGEFGELGLAYGQVKYGDEFLEEMLRRNFYFDLRLAEPWPFGRIIDSCRMLQDLVTLGLDHPSAVTGVTFEHEQQRDDRGEKKRPPVRPYMRSIGHSAGEQFGEMSIGNAMFTFDDIGGMVGVLKWLEVASRYRVVVGTLVGNMYAPSPYAESEFFNACTAAEAFRRMQLRKQNLNLSKELPVLARHAGDVFKELVGDVDKWVKRVVQTRINVVVHRGLRSGADVNEIIWLADSLHLLIVLCLLEECGVQRKAEARIRYCHRSYRLNQPK